MEGPVLLTGWKGRVGQAILEELAEDYEWRLLDRDPPTGDPPGEALVADITDREAIREAVEGVSVVVHLAGDSRREAPWDSLIENNIDGTQVVYQAAARAAIAPRTAPDEDIENGEPGQLPATRPGSGTPARSA